MGLRIVFFALLLTGSMALQMTLRRKQFTRGGDLVVHDPSPQQQQTRSGARQFNQEADAIANSTSGDFSTSAVFGKQGGNWCPGGCHTNFEKAYLSEHAAELQEGLATLRGWRCVPESQFVVSAGYFRTGSTLLYNVARLWLELAFPGKLSSGYGCAGRDAGQGATLCKEHSLSSKLAEKVDVLLMSHRDVHATVCARLAVQAQHGNSPSAAIVSQQCQDLRKQQAAVYTSLAAVGKRVAHDVLTTESGLDEAEFTAVARGLGICESAATNPQLLIFMKSMAEHLHSHPGDSGLITQMHPPTTDHTKQELCSNLSDWIAEDAECARWAAQSGGVHANNFVEVGLAPVRSLKNDGNAPKVPRHAEMSGHAPASFAAQVKAAADKETNTIVMVESNSGFHPMLQNWVANAKKVGLQNYIVAALDTSEYLRLQAEGIPSVLYEDMKFSPNAMKFRQGDYPEIVMFKWRMVLDALNVGVNVVLSDTDVILLKNPLQDLMFNNSKCDMLFSSATGGMTIGGMNAGFALIRTEAKASMQKFWDWTLEQPTNDDQILLKEYLGQKLGLSASSQDNCEIYGNSEDKVSFGMLQSKKYMGGRHAWGAKEGETPGALKADPFTCHYNQINGQDMKIEQMRKNSHWLLEDGSPPLMVQINTPFTSASALEIRKMQNTDGCNLGVTFYSGDPSDGCDVSFKSAGYFHRMVAVLKKHPCRVEDEKQATFSLQCLGNERGQYASLPHRTPKSPYVLWDPYTSQNYEHIPLHPGTLQRKDFLWIGLDHRSHLANEDDGMPGINVPPPSKAKITERDPSISPKFFLTFQGHGRRSKWLDSTVREDLMVSFDNHTIESVHVSFSKDGNYDELMHTAFALIPAGDERWSFRFSEAIQACAIPVVMSDGYDLPFDGAVDWKTASVRIPEAFAKQAISLDKTQDMADQQLQDAGKILQMLPRDPEIIKTMRKAVCDIKHKYFDGVDKQAEAALMAAAYHLRN